MAYSQRPLRDQFDLTAMLTLVQQHPEEHLHVVDLPYRLCSWAFDVPENSALWHDADGRLLAWAVLQSPFWAFDYAAVPDAPFVLLETIFDWAERRMHALQGTSYARPMWFLSAFAGHRHEALFAQFGWASQANVGENSWTKVMFEQNFRIQDSAGAASSVSSAVEQLPLGFSVRPLAGENEVAAYVALHRAVFQSESMTEDWRRRTLAHPDYERDIDLVLVDGEGQLRQFSVSAGSRRRGPNQLPAGQIEPFGIREDLRRTGLGRALLVECLRRMQVLGVASVFVETDNYRDAAYQFYQALGFHVARDVLVYRRDSV
ncbi:GNAT family N-acetyltransferase [Candidatus Gracilibacteria bacterium]|nr:GNAT family N-acetyltransferase [Candidatus Gracilibacteria bacterium]